MQKLILDNAVPGLELMKDIYNTDGNILLGKGCVLTDSYIKRLKDIGVNFIFVKNDLFEGIEYEEPIRPELKAKTIKTIKKTFTDFEKTLTIDVKSCYALSQNIVDDILNSKQALIHLDDIQTYDDYTYGHCLNVCILSTMLARDLNFDRVELRKIALGGMLHDIGKICIPSEIINKPGKLTDAEFSAVKQHPEEGFSILRERKWEVSLLSAHIAYQHHEKYDGTGYPRKLAGEEIHPYARIVAIADVYDAIISDRPYRKGMLPHVAYEIMAGSSGTHFDAHMLDVFLKKIAVYPVGTLVSLNSGEIGVVEGLSNMPTRPHIRVIADKDLYVCKSPFVIDLEKERTVFIDKVLPQDTLYTLRKRKVS